MAYIGKQPLVGNFVKLDAITTSATTTFNLLNGGVAYYPQSANNCLVSLNGILQAPTDSYTISGSTIIFSNALTTSDVIDFIIVLGDVLNIGTPSDNTVSTAKLVNSSVTAAKVATGAVVQVVSTTKTDTFASSSIANTFVDVTGLSVSITPSSASNKILILATVNHGTDGIRATALKLLRDSTAINIGTASGNRTAASTVAIGENYDSNRGEVSSINYLDSPSTTSSVTYKIQIGIIESTGNVARVNTSGADGDFTYIARAASTITVMEIKG